MRVRRVSAPDSPPVEWLDLLDPTREELTAAVSRTLHPRALDQLLAPQCTATTRGQRSRVTATTCSESSSPRLDPGTSVVTYQEVDLVAAHDLVLTVRKSADGFPPFDCSVVRELHGHGRATSAGMVAYHLVDEVAEGYLDLTDRLNERIDDLEDHVEEWPSERVREQLSTLRHDVLHIRRTLAPTRDAIRRVFDDRVDARRDSIELFDHDTELHFADAFEKLMRASEALDLSRDLVSSVRDYHQAQVSNDQNEVMKRLTVVASLLLLPSFIVGFYGMNVRGEPEYRWR